MATGDRDSDVAAYDRYCESGGHDEERAPSCIQCGEPVIAGDDNDEISEGSIHSSCLDAWERERREEAREARLEERDRRADAAWLWRQQR